ncbi:OmpA family protein [Streptosporangium sandarakinum]|uniref:OmpA family protein n=1 Tax=Streptosporangium sandarakinum TaxID=1260955 RepID=UPI0036763B5F
MSEGMVGFYSANPFRIEVKAIERHAKLTVLRMEIMTTATVNTSGDFGYGNLTTSFDRFRLFDPVGRKVYFTLRENNSDGHAFGTRNHQVGADYPDDFVPGVRYPVEVYFPPLPATAESMSIAPDLPMGPMTGIPVTGGAAEPTARERGSSDMPKAGDTFQWPVVVPNGEIWSGVADVNELVETPVRSTTQAGDKETIGLRTDVLFAFDKARLSAKAAAVLDDVVEETRRRADPAKPPITITGHTDDKGDDGYNQTLSVKRAKAVQEYLAARLGTGYQYRFDITKVNDGLFVPFPIPFSGWDDQFSAGSDFGAFILVDPATKARYHPLKMYTEFVENYVPALDAGETSRAYVYYPAPPDDRTSITLEVANGGVYPRIPIER